MYKFATLILLSVSTLSFADLGPAKSDAGKITLNDNQRYKLEGDLSYLLNSSRSNGQSSHKENLAAHLLLQRQAGIWGQELKAEAVSANDDGDASKNVERYMMSGKVLHRSSDNVYQFAKLQGDKDLMSSFDYQIALTGGAGLELIQKQRQELVAEVGTGYRYSQLQDRNTKHDAGDYSELIGTLALFYQYKFNDVVKFNQDLGYEFGDKSQTLRSRSSVSASLTQSISGLVSYQLKDVKADDGNSRDALLSVGLRYQH
ncbi:putative salt-induced outer membrane protein YdiY [Acinetobacter calcoaceticus]|uniref:Putative salt-induced outer membrane protein YdiY n=1 Tax=Acinetobacter calcoaceticus TaxID=471 RepID=A0A4R1XMW1_ACICA|nr:putative salt-induced outer membrane protein YdiY [Acinetobacter calcoaceticus]